MQSLCKLYVHLHDMICLIPEHVESAYVNISLSSTNVIINGSLNITLLDFNPVYGSREFERIDFHYVRPGESVRTIAELPRLIRRLHLRTVTMSKEYVGRLTV